MDAVALLRLSKLIDEAANAASERLRQERIVAWPSSPESSASQPRNLEPMGRTRGQSGPGVNPGVPVFLWSCPSRTQYQNVTLPMRRRHFPMAFASTNTQPRITHMLAFIPVLFPLIPVLLGAGVGAAVVAACKSDNGKKAKIAKLKARIEALERKP